VPTSVHFFKEKVEKVLMKRKVSFGRSFRESRCFNCFLILVIEEEYMWRYV
jgi:RNase P subunit RPR2